MSFCPGGMVPDRYGIGWIKTVGKGLGGRAKRKADEYKGEKEFHCAVFEFQC